MLVAAQSAPAGAAAAPEASARGGTAPQEDSLDVFMSSVATQVEQNKVRQHTLSMMKMLSLMQFMVRKLVLLCSSSKKLLKLGCLSSIR